MLILSQDERGIVNLDNVIYITTNTYSEECSGISCNSLNNLEIYLGEYDTEERAKEVLQEIINEYKSQNYLVYDAETGSIKDVNKNIVFIMPKE